MSVKEYFNSAFSKEGEPSQEDLDRVRFIRDHIPDGTRTVLEVGCGTGIVTRALAERYEVTGLELSTVGVQEVKALGINCVQGSIAALPFPDRSFDAVVCSEVLEHLEEPIYIGGLRQMTRVALKYVVITVPYRERLASSRAQCPHCRTVCVPWGHLRSFDVGALRHLLDGLGFTARTTITFGLPTPDLHCFVNRMLRSHRLLYNPLGPGRTCPICGFEVPGQPITRRTLWGDLSRRPLPALAHILDFLAIKLSPKNKPRWILAVYERQ